MGFDDTEVNGGDTSLAIGTESHGSDSRTTPAEKGVWKAGPVTIQLAGANVTRQKVIAKLRLIVGGKAVDTCQITTTSSSRREPAQLIVDLACQAGEPVDRRQVLSLLGNIIAEAEDAARSAEKKPKGPTIRQILSDLVHDNLGFTHRGRGASLWSECDRREWGRTEFVTYCPAYLIDACSRASDAPRDASGNTSDQAVLRAVQAGLAVLWSTLMDQLPRFSDIDPATSLAGVQQFRRSIVSVWQKPGICCQFRIPGGKQQQFSKLSLAAVAREFDRSLPGGGGLSGSWVRLDDNLDAWCRAADNGKDGRTLTLAMRFDLAEQAHAIIVGCDCQEDLVRLGEKTGAGIGGGPVGDWVEGKGVPPLLILSQDVAKEILFSPESSRLSE